MGLVISFSMSFVDGVGRTEFISKKAVRMVEIECQDDADPQWPPLSLMHLVQVTAVFTDATTLSGQLMLGGTRGKGAAFGLPQPAGCVPERQEREQDMLY